MAFYTFIKKFLKAEFKGFYLFVNTLLFCWFFAGFLTWNDVQNAALYAACMVLFFSLMTYSFIRTSIEEILS